MGIKAVIGLTQGKCVQRELNDEQSSALYGKKIGSKVDGATIGLEGYEFEVTGGSDHCGFPMRWDVPGVGRKRIFAVEGIGLKKKGKGVKQRKTMCGNTIHPKIHQVSLKVLKEGKESLLPPEKTAETTKPTEQAPKPAEQPAAPAAPAAQPAA